MSDNNKSKLPTSWKIIIALVVGGLVGAFVMSAASARDVYVDGHVRKDGTYVAPHHRSAPDRNPYNNYGSQGNTNPYTGQQGNVQPQPNYGQPQPFYGSPNGNNRGQSGIYPR